MIKLRFGFFLEFSRIKIYTTCFKISGERLMWVLIGIFYFLLTGLSSISKEKLQ